MRAPLNFNEDGIWRWVSAEMMEKFKGAIIGIKEIDGKSGGHQIIRAAYIGCDEEHLDWWFMEGAGKKLRTDGWYHLCCEKPSGCSAVKGKADIIHASKMRSVGPGDFDARILTLFAKKGLKESFWRQFGEYSKWQEKNLNVPKLSGKGTTVLKKPPTVDWGDESDEDEEDIEEEDEESTEEKAFKERDRKVSEKLQDLKKKLAEAEAEGDELRRMRDEKKRKKMAEETAKKEKKKNKKDKKSKKEKRVKGKGSGESSEPAPAKKKAKSLHDPPEQGGVYKGKSPREGGEEEEERNGHQQQCR